MSPFEKSATSLPYTHIIVPFAPFVKSANAPNRVFPIAVFTARYKDYQVVLTSSLTATFAASAITLST